MYKVDRQETVKFTLNLKNINSGNISPDLDSLQLDLLHPTSSTDSSLTLSRYSYTQIICFTFHPLNSASGPHGVQLPLCSRLYPSPTMVSKGINMRNTLVLSGRHWIKVERNNNSKAVAMLNGYDHSELSSNTVNIGVSQGNAFEGNDLKTFNEFHYHGNNYSDSNSSSPYKNDSFYGNYRAATDIHLLLGDEAKGKGVTLRKEFYETNPDFTNIDESDYHKCDYVGYVLSNINIGFDKDTPQIHYPFYMNKTSTVTSEANPVKTVTSESKTDFYIKDIYPEVYSGFYTPSFATVTSVGRSIATHLFQTVPFEFTITRMDSKEKIFNVEIKCFFRYQGAYTFIFSMLNSDDEKSYVLCTKQITVKG